MTAPTRTPEMPPRAPHAAGVKASSVLPLGGGADEENAQHSEHEHLDGPQHDKGADGEAHAEEGQQPGDDRQRYRPDPQRQAAATGLLQGVPEGQQIEGQEQEISGDADPAG